MSRKPKDRTLFQSLILGNPGPVAALRAAAHRIDELAAVRGNVLRGNVKSPGRAARGQLPARAAATLDESSKRSHHQPILIIVEDDPDDFMLLKRALWKAGATARVWWARDVSEALEILAQVETFSSRICVVADVHLPGFSGFELLGLIKARPGCSHVKFAFLTGDTDRLTEDRAHAGGADAFFVKPPKAEDLVELARALQQLALAGMLIAPLVPRAVRALDG